jgi:hypothetical protein
LWSQNRPLAFFNHKYIIVERSTTIEWAHHPPPPQIKRKWFQAVISDSLTQAQQKCHLCWVLLVSNITQFEHFFTKPFKRFYQPKSKCLLLLIIYFPQWLAMAMHTEFPQTA